jgi:membrane protein YqaA with SNARE-associated domain
MGAWYAIGGAALYLSCFGMSIVSALVPWVNGEALLIIAAALARSPWDLVCLVLLASAGQMVGKCVLYWAGRGTVRFKSVRVGRTLSAWRERFEKSPTKSFALVFVSSALGIPPFYVVTVLAGALRVQFGRFVAVGTCGRLVRFGLIVFMKPVVLQLWHRL